MYINTGFGAQVRESQQTTMVRVIRTNNSSTRAAYKVTVTSIVCVAVQ